MVMKATRTRKAAMAIPVMMEGGRALDDLCCLGVAVAVALEGGRTGVSFLGTLVSGKRACETVKVLRS